MVNFVQVKNQYLSPIAITQTAGKNMLKIAEKMDKA